MAAIYVVGAVVGLCDPVQEVNQWAWCQKIVTWARMKSPWILHFNTGACNACDIEIIAALTPRYDLERFGVQLKGTPRHADVLVCSGPGDPADQGPARPHLRADARAEVRGGRRHLRLLAAACSRAATM